MTEAAISEQFISCAAVLIVSDIHRSAAFYRDQLGFEVAEIWGDPPSFAIANAPRASIMLKQGIDKDAPGNPTQNVKIVLRRNANISQRLTQPIVRISNEFEKNPKDVWAVVEAIRFPSLEKQMSRAISGTAQNLSKINR